MRKPHEIISKTYKEIKEKIYPSIVESYDFAGYNYKGVRVGDVYLHFKHEKDSIENILNYMYIVIDIAEHTESGEPLIIYKALYGNHKTYARPAEMFISPVDKVKYDKIEQNERMRYIFNIARHNIITDPLAIDAIIDYGKNLRIDLDGDLIQYAGNKYYVHVLDKLVFRLNIGELKICKHVAPQEN